MAIAASRKMAVYRERLRARGLRPVHEWTGGFERFWNESFDRLDKYVQELEQTTREE